MRRIQVQKTIKRTDALVAPRETQLPEMDCRDLDVVRAKELQRERKC
jgi:hypothetical protein